MSAEITYLRKGRTKRSKGRLILTDNASGMFKVKPSRKSWKAIWITIHEMQAGGNTHQTPSAPHHSAAVSKMVDGLKQLLARNVSDNGLRGSEQSTD